MKQQSRIISLALASLFLLAACTEVSSKSVSIKEPANPNKSTLGNVMLDEAVQNYLLSQEYFSWKTSDAGRNICTFEKLDPKSELFPYYLWVRCGEFAMQNGRLEDISGMSGPVVIDYPNELSFYDIDRMTHTVPRDGSLYSEDVKEIFPAHLHELIFDYDRSAINQRIKNLAEAKFAS